MTMTRGATLLVALMTVAVSGCGGSVPESGIVSGPSAISQAPTPIQPIVAAIAPAIGSTAGGAWGTITGGQFQSGAAVRLGTDLTQSFVFGDSTIGFWSHSHVPGVVDVVVTNPGGLSSSFAAAFTFAPPESFDFTGEWVAHAGSDYEESMHFTIRNDLLVSLTCGSSYPVMLSPPPVVKNGAFSFRADDGVAIDGHMVSTEEAFGTINVPGCAATFWWGEKGLAMHPAMRGRPLLDHR
jgi:hypothetical protein